ncbi:MAG: rubrerythrin [Candidatus Coatesbacteria bacterium]|nr:rubrerythrin [Candidatus Coatesbacteria bacterium]
MGKFSSVDEVLEFAMAREQESVDFYTDLAERVKRPEMKKVFLQFADEERNHKAKLQAVKQGKNLLPSEKAVTDLKIADYVVEVEIKEQMDYQEALIVAMKKEKAAYKLYSELAELTEDAALTDTFRALAQEEAKHKLRFEVEYDDNVLSADW